MNKITLLYNTMQERVCMYNTLYILKNFLTLDALGEKQTNRQIFYTLLIFCLFITVKNKRKYQYNKENTSTTKKIPVQQRKYLHNKENNFTEKQIPVELSKYLYN